MSPAGDVEEASNPEYYHDNFGNLLDLKVLSDDDWFSLQLTDDPENVKDAATFKRMLHGGEWYNLGVDDAAAADEIMRRGWAKVRLWSKMGKRLTLGTGTLTDAHMHGLQVVAAGEGLPDSTAVELSQENPPRVVSTTVGALRRARRLSDLER